MFVARLKKEGIVVVENSLDAQMNAAIAEFRQSASAATNLLQGRDLSSNVICKGDLGGS